MPFIERKLNNDPTNCWALHSSCVEAMLRSSGMKILHEPADEIYFCQRNQENPSVAVSWNRSEYLSAIGEEWKVNAMVTLGNK